MIVRIAIDLQGEKKISECSVQVMIIISVQVANMQVVIKAQSKYA